ncbi:hypothetical protein ACV8SB_24120 [Citrobacter freundii]
MELIKREVKLLSYVSEYRCDMCGIGMMIYQGEDGNDIRYDVGVGILFRHSCDCCHVEGYLAKRYPFLSQGYQ